MRVTLKDIAIRSGFSPITVSRALNDKQDVNSETKEKILSIAYELGYFPNMLARGLKSNKTKTLGIILRDIADPFYAEILKSVTEVALKDDYQIILTTNSKESANMAYEMKSLRMLLEKQIDGLLLMPEHEDTQYFKFLKKTKIPFVLLNRVPRGIDCDYVTTDQSEGSRLAVHFFYHQGVREIYYFVRTPITCTVLTRISACQKAARDNGLNESSIHVIECGDNVANAFEVAYNLINLKNGRIGIYAWDDMMAMGIAKAVLQRGLKIPDDISIIGYDDIEMSKFYNPAITTIRQDMLKIGQLATEILIGRINNSISPEKKHVNIIPELITRETT